MDILESLIMYFCIAFALILVYMVTTDKPKSMSEEFDDDRADAMARGILGEDHDR